MRTLRGILAMVAAMAGAAALPGCGSTRTSNTLRTATEQLLISDAIDRTVEALDFSPLRDQQVFLDDSRLVDVVDKGYLISSLRQRMLASGIVLKPTREEATYVVEPRAGAVGTDDHDLLFGVPALQVPQVPLAPALPAAIPEIPFAKRRYQRGVAKLAVFAYRRDTGEPVYQTGIAMKESTANDFWVLGAGPFKRGTIYDQSRRADERAGHQGSVLPDDGQPLASMADEAVFHGLRAPSGTPLKGDGKVVQASGEMPIEVEPDDKAVVLPKALPLATAPAPSIPPVPSP